jgi:aspartate carbamoyltransferase regulatory subunit
MILSIKDRLEARVRVGQIIRFTRLLKIMKSLGHALYIYSNNGGAIIDHVEAGRYPCFVKIVDIFERENQIWSMGEMIMATVVKIEGVK